MRIFKAVNPLSIYPPATQKCLIFKSNVDFSCTVARKCSINSLLPIPISDSGIVIKSRLAPHPNLVKPLDNSSLCSNSPFQTTQYTELEGTQERAPSTRMKKHPGLENSDSHNFDTHHISLKYKKMSYTNGLTSVLAYKLLHS